MSARQDLRQQDRKICKQPVTVMWRDGRGDDKFAQAEALDICAKGLRFRLPEAIPFQACISLRAIKLGIHGQAMVRHCSRLGAKFAVGVQFTGELRCEPVAQATS